MGFFSWKTSDTDQSIPNRYCEGRETFPVKMLDDKGNEWIETNYEGYGDFGGMDYYALLSRMNEGKLKNHNFGERERARGIEIEFNKRLQGVKRPKLVTLHCKKTWQELPDSKMCDGQGYWL